MSGSNEVVTNMDRISNLPEDVIGDILSRMSTEDAVKTSVLSKDWKYKWTFINRIDIDDTDPYGRDLDDSVFDKYVKRTLLLVKNAKRITLKFFSQSSDRLESWLDSLSIHTVEELDLEIDQDYLLYSDSEHAYSDSDSDQDLFSDIEQEYVLSSSLLNLSNLRRLRLILPTFAVSSKNQFPNLTSMRLHKVKVANRNVGDDTLIFTFPVLETLWLDKCKWFNVKFVEINAPALNNLRILCHTTSYSERDHCTISINSAKLAVFEIEDLQENILLNGSTVVSASFMFTNLFPEGEILRMIGVRVRSLLRQMSSSLKYLRLSLSAAQYKAILEPKQVNSYPRVKLDKLEELCLESSHIFSAQCGTEALFELLYAAPSLKVLSINLAEWTDFKCDESVMESVPSCIASSLEEVRLCRYRENRSRHGLEELLQQAGVRIKKFPHSY